MPVSRMPLLASGTTMRKKAPMRDAFPIRLVRGLHKVLNSLYLGELKWIKLFSTLVKSA